MLISIVWWAMCSEAIPILFSESVGVLASGRCRFVPFCFRVSFAFIGGLLLFVYFLSLEPFYFKWGAWGLDCDPELSFPFGLKKLYAVCTRRL